MSSDRVSVQISWVFKIKYSLMRFPNPDCSDATIISVSVLPINNGLPCLTQNRLLGVSLQKITSPHDPDILSCAAFIHCSTPEISLL